MYSLKSLSYLHVVKTSYALENMLETFFYIFAHHLAWIFISNPTKATSSLFQHCCIQTRLLVQQRKRYHSTTFIYKLSLDLSNTFCQHHVYSILHKVVLHQIIAAHIHFTNSTTESALPSSWTFNTASISWVSIGSSRTQFCVLIKFRGIIVQSLKLLGQISHYPWSLILCFFFASCTSAPNTFKMSQLKSTAFFNS